MKTLVAFHGRTAFEIQVGHVWVKVLYPKLWCRGNLSRLIQVGVQS